MQVPLAQDRAQAYSPAAASLYTGENPATAQGIASHLFQAPNITDAATLAAASTLYTSGLSSVRHSEPMSS